MRWEQLKVIKRDGRKVDFNKEKIETAIKKAFIEVDKKETEESIKISNKIATEIEKIAKSAKEPLKIEEIQDLCENKLMRTKRKDVAKAYIAYRNERTRIRGNTTDKDMFEVLSGTSDYWSKENSNKDSKIVTTQRDYLAGIASTDIARRFLLPKEVCEAHDLGVIHQHDMDYLAQFALNNCGLINLEDMLQNGTVINGVQIDPQHRLSTASTVATQIITAVASSQYGKPQQLPY